MISPKVMSELHQAKLVPTQFTVPKPGEHAWSPAEQRLFWEAIQRFPQGPWTAIAAYVGTKSTRQAMTHAQKLRQKLSRWKRRVRSDSMGSTGSNSSSATTPAEAYAGSNDSQSPPMSPTEYGNEIAKLSIMDHIQEEDEKRSVDGEAYEPMKSETQQSGDYREDVYDAHDDRYLEHLLSDIEPVLEHVAHFTNGSHDHNSESSTRTVVTTDYSSEQAVYFTHPVDLTASEHKNMELSVWHQHTTFHEPMQYTPTQGGDHHNHNYQH